MTCLKTLMENGDFEMAKVVVVDDASPDGTAVAVSESFPMVHLLYGDGTLWWGGGIRLGMEWALSQPDCDGVVWLNDDCKPLKGVIPTIIAFAQANNAIATVQATTPNGFVYGGHVKTVFGLKPVKVSNSVTVFADACNGNCVAFPKSILEKVGLFSAREYPQNYGDSDYTLRATRLGLSLVVIGGLNCVNDQNVHLSHARWTDHSNSIRSLVSTWSSPRSLLYPPARFHFFFRHWGIWGFVLASFVYFRFGLIVLIRSMLPSN